MAHIKTSHLGLWKPQDLNLDKISSQKMFIDNIDILDNRFFYINNRLGNIERIPVYKPMYDQGSTEYEMVVPELGRLLLLYETNGSNGEFNIRLPDVSSIDVGKRVMIHSVDCNCMITPYQGVIIDNQHDITISAGDTVTMILVEYSNKSSKWLAILNRRG